MVTQRICSLTRERKVNGMSIMPGIPDDWGEDESFYTVEDLKNGLRKIEERDNWQKPKNTAIIATIALLLGLAKPALVFWSMLTHSALGLFVLLSGLCIVVIVPLAEATAQRFFGDGELYVDDDGLELYTWAKNHIFMLLVPAWVLFDLCYALVVMQAGYPEIVTIIFLIISAVPAIASLLVVVTFIVELAFGLLYAGLSKADIFAGMPSISDTTKGK